jgi:hypothetical protein
MITRTYEKIKEEISCHTGGFSRNESLETMQNELSSLHIYLPTSSIPFAESPFVKKCELALNDFLLICLTLFYIK